MKQGNKMIKIEETILDRAKLFGQMGLKPWYGTVGYFFFLCCYLESMFYVGSWYHPIRYLLFCTKTAIQHLILHLTPGMIWHLIGIWSDNLCIGSDIWSGSWIYHWMWGYVAVKWDVALSPTSTEFNKQIYQKSRTLQLCSYCLFLWNFIFEGWK